MKKLCALLAATVLLSGCGTAARNLNTGGAPAEESAAPEAALYQSRDLSGTEAGAETQSERSLPEATAQAAEALPQGPLVYTRFPGKVEQVCSPDGTVVFEGNYSTAVITTQSLETNHDLSACVEALEEQMVRESSGLPEAAQSLYAYRLEQEDSAAAFYPYSSYISARTERQDSQVLSVVLVSRVYRGGSHPNSQQAALNFDLQTRKQLTLGDILQQNREEALLELVLASLEEEIETLNRFSGSTGVYGDYRRMVSESILEHNETLNWYFSDSGLVVYYDPYAIAPYAAGRITVELPYAQLTGILQESYLPKEPAWVPGSRLVPAAKGTISLSFETPGETASWEQCVGVEGTVYRVRMYAVVSWLDEETPVPGNLVFSANRLTEGEGLQITANSPRSGAYLLTCQTAREETQTISLDQFSFREIAPGALE